MLGAEVYPVPAVAYENPKNYNHQARDFAKSLPNAIWTDQFDNVANTRAHYTSTGPEIWEQTDGNVDAFICATGTGGTLAGTGMYLKEKSRGKTQVWLADPPGSVLCSYLTSGGSLMERSGSSITEGAYMRYFARFLCFDILLGIGQGRITKNLGTFVNELDGALTIPDAESLEMVYDLLDSEGLYLGASSALNVVAAYKVAQKVGPGMPRVFPDEGLLSQLFYRQDCCYHSLRWCLPVSEPPVLKSLGKVKGAGRRDSSTPQEVHGTRLKKCIPGYVSSMNALISLPQFWLVSFGPMLELVCDHK